MTNMKRCSSCGEEKLTSEFYKRRAGKDGLHCWCKVCLRKYRVAHREECRAQDRKRWAENSEVKTKINRRWRAKNREGLAEKSRKYRAENREEVAEYHLRYRVEHPEIMRLYSQRKRARKGNAAGYDYTTAEHIAARCEMWGNRCYICDAPMESVDHVKPLAKGGSHFPANLRPACKACNSRKGAKWPVDFDELRQSAKDARQ